MQELHNPVKQCLAIGHVYCDTLVIRCQHRESYSVRVAVWIDHPVEGTVCIHEDIREFGPFDSHEFISRTVSEMQQVANERVMAY